MASAQTNSVDEQIAKKIERRRNERQCLLDYYKVGEKGFPSHDRLTLSELVEFVDEINYNAYFAMHEGYRLKDHENTIKQRDAYHDEAQRRCVDVIGMSEEQYKKFIQNEMMLHKIHKWHYETDETQIYKKN